MKNSLLFILFLIVFSVNMRAQLEKVIVEKYYISDANDASDTVGGRLPAGDTTYRVYIDLKPGSKLNKIYGDANHTLKISSDSVFFNNVDRGQTFGKDFSKNNLGENTVAVDTWLTLGQVAKTNLGRTYFGILKTQDRDSSFIGGINNDEGLLINNDASAGIPLTIADGIDTMNAVPSSWANYGIIDIVSGVDSTIFGSVKKGNQFVSNDVGLQNSGVTGVIPENNQILVAQLTTNGGLTFQLNIEVEEPDGLSTKIVKYVADDHVLLADEKLSRYLSYPFTLKCGCPDPNFLEYASDRDCDNSDSCRTKIVFGCTDTSACNYDPKANFNIQYLCCYPGYCNDRNMEVVCPDISSTIEFTAYPNPAQDQLTLQISAGDDKEINYEIHNSFGIVMLKKNLGTLSGPVIEEINISDLDKGLYLIRVNMGTISQTKLFMKN